MILRGYYLVSLVCASAILSFSCVSNTGEESPRCGRRFEKRATKLYATENHNRLYEFILPCASSGRHAEAQFLIGLLYGADEDGEIFKLDEEERLEKAISWIRRSAINGNEEALLAIADSYESGWFNLPKDSDLEACWRSTIEDRDKIQKCLQLESEVLE